jgi:D-amino-acid oxidase
MTSYHAFDKLQQILPVGDLPQHGIAMRMANFFFDRPVQDMPDELEKMNEISTHDVRLQHYFLCY